MLKKVTQKITVILLASACIISAISCLPSQTPAQETGQIWPWGNKFGKVLIVYYSLSGNTKEMASVIQGYTGGDLYALETSKTYPAIPEIYEVIKQEIKSNDWPQLKPGLPDLRQYDVIFVGGPVWWYTLSTPLLSFLATTDFQGKPVLPFCSHGGNYGAFFKRFSQDAKNAVVLQGLDFYRPLQVSKSLLSSTVADWLSGLHVPANDR